MHLRIKTVVNGNYKEIYNRFDEKLFDALTPKTAPLYLVKFTGTEVGGLVHLKFKFPLKSEWVSDVIENHQSETEIYFIDEGRVLPFGIKYWHHKHIIKRISDNKTGIIDDINFNASNQFLTILLYPLIFMGMYPRKNGYVKYFKK